MEERYLKSYFIGPSAIKALMDSGPLGEAVLRAIENNKNFRPNGRTRKSRSRNAR